MMNYPKATLEEYGYKNHKVEKTIFKIFSKVMVVLIIIVMYLPILVIAIQSVNSSLQLSSFDHFTLKWYSIFLSRDPADMQDVESLVNAINVTFRVSIIATIISTVVGTLFAVGINAMPPKKRQRILMLNNIPLLNADIVTGVSLMLVFKFLMIIFPGIFGYPTLILAHLFFTLPYVILSVLPKFKEIDPNLMDAALDLGVKPYRALRKVIVPSIKAGIFSGMLFAFTMSVDDFVVSYFTNSAETSNLSTWIYASIGRRSLTPAVYAFSTMLTLLTLVILLTINFIGDQKGRKIKHEKN